MATLRRAGRLSSGAALAVAAPAALLVLLIAGFSFGRLWRRLGAEARRMEATA